MEFWPILWILLNQRSQGRKKCWGKDLEVKGHRVLQLEPLAQGRLGLAQKASELLLHLPIGQQGAPPARVNPWMVWGSKGH